VLDGSCNNSQKTALQVLKDCMDDWYRIPCDLDDRQLAREMGQIQKGLKPLSSSLSETRDAMSIIRTISEHAEKTGQLNSMVEILQYGMLEVACHIVDHDPQKASAGRSSPASCGELIATLCILSQSPHIASYTFRAEPF
jgi:hypothetical protein